MNFSSAAITFNNTPVASATNITTLAAGKVAQYDSTAVSSIATTAGNIVAGGETDTVSGFETVIGSAKADYIALANTGMTVTGGAGDDKIVAAAGTDTIYVDAGNDTITAFGGSDVLNVTAAATAAVAVSSDWTATAASVNDGTDEGDAILTLANGVDANADGATAAATQGYTITAAGNAAASIIVGSDAVDVITAGAGGDTITGGTGVDVITLGAGSDTVILGVVAGNDTLGGFVHAADKIQMGGTSAAVGVLTAAAAANTTAHAIAFDTAAELGAGGITIGDGSTAAAVVHYAVLSDTGAIFYDADGDWTAGSVAIGVLGAVTGLTAADDFTVA